MISTIATAESGFYTLAQKHLQLAVQERSFNLAKALEMDVKEKIAAGESSQLEATRAELQSAQSEVDYMSSQIDYEAALQEFRRSLAYDNAEGEGVFPDPKALEFNVEDFKIPADAEKEIRKSNPTISLTRIAKQIAEADLELSRNATLPTLGFTTSYGNASPGETVINATTESLHPNDRTFSVALTYTQILYNDTSRNAFEKAVLAKQKAELTIDDTERKVMRDFDSLNKRLDIGARRHRIAKLSREIAEKKLNSEYEKFKAGESSVRNVIDTQTEVNNARISEIAARVDLLLGYGQLNALQGRLPEGVTLGIGN